MKTKALALYAGAFVCSLFALTSTGKKDSVNIGSKYLPPSLGML